MRILPVICGFTWLHNLPKRLMFCLLYQLKQFKADNADVGFGSGTLALDQSIERTVANMKWIAANKDNVLNWFSTEGNPTAH